MAHASLFDTDRRAPDGLWDEVYLRTKNSLLRQARPDSYSLSYVLISSGHRFKPRKKASPGFEGPALNYWVEEFEKTGCIGVYDYGSVLVFEKNVPYFLRPRVALRYHMFTPNPPYPFDEKGFVTLCKSELESVLSRTDEECRQYRAWIVSSSQNQVSYPGELLVHLFPSVIEVLEHDTRDARKVLQGLMPKLNQFEEDPSKVKSIRK